jgi:hypothetical protein
VRSPRRRRPGCPWPGSTPERPLGVEGPCFVSGGDRRRPRRRRTGREEGGAGGRTLPPPGVLATWLAPRLVVQTGRDARRSSANVRLPATAQVEAVQPFALDGLPGTTPAGHPSWSGGGTRLRRVLLRWQAPQPCRFPSRPPWSGQSNPWSVPWVNPWSDLCAGNRSTFLARPVACSGWWMPLRGASRPQKPRPTGPPQGEWSAPAVRCASRD